MGRRGLAAQPLAFVHPVNRTPSVAIIWLGLATALLMFAGQSILVPITEVGSLASLLGWMASCAAFLRMQPPSMGRFVAILGIAVTLLLLFLKVLPQVPGHFTTYEWLALAVWVVLGILLRRNPH